MSREPGRPHILVIDDDEAMGRLIVRVLSSENEVTLDPDPHSALRRLLAGEGYDMILCDVVMPGLNGIDLYRALLASAPAAAEKVLLMTGGGLPAEQENFLRTCAALKLAKPFSPAALREQVRSFARRAIEGR